MHSYNQFIYSRERRLFGRQPLFSDKNQLMLSIHPSLKHRLNYILRNPINRCTQLSDQKALSIMITENVTFNDHGMCHYEGGWPREVNIHDEEQTIRHRKKVEREDNWGIQVANLISNALEVAYQNSAVNIYEYFFEDLPQDAGSDIKWSFESRPENLFHDPYQNGRHIAILQWMPNEIEHFLVQHTNLAVLDMAVKAENPDQVKTITGNAFYIWNLDNPLKALIVFDGLEPIRQARVCPRDDNWVAGGFQSGKVPMWETVQGGFPLQICPLEVAHREAVSSICWVHSKTNSEFYTGSYDGSIKYWDGRDLSEPIQELLLDPEQTDEQSRDRAHGVTVLEFEYTIPVRYIIASDMGHIFIGNRKGMTPTETLLANFRLFAGPIRTIERNPFFVKNFLIVGDWIARIWAEENKGSPNTLLVKKKSQMLCGTWSTTRCSLFVTGAINGDLDFWDLLLNQRKPIFTYHMKVAITAVKFRSDGEYLALALKNGDTYVFELDNAIKHSASKDKALIAALFEREQLRCKLLEGRVEEIKLRRRLSSMPNTQAEEPDADKRKSEQLTDLDATDPDQFLQILESDSEFKETLRQFTEIIYKVEKKRQEREYIMERTEFEPLPVEEVVEEEISPEPTNDLQFEQEGEEELDY